jgi:cytochrome c
MDSFEVNKMIAAILLVALIVIGIGKISSIIFYVEKPKTPGYSFEIEENSTDTPKKSAKQENIVDMAALMAQGNLEEGKKIFKKCASCHSIVKNGGNKIGPALYNVVGRTVGGVTDYKYSKTLAAYEKEWTFEELNGFLKKPSTYLKGTKMAYAGLRKEKDRASIIIYLNQNGDSPKPLP